MSSDIILRTTDLSKRYKKRWAVSNLNISVRKGEVFGFLGPNGAGKSTTIRMLFSLVKPTSGGFELFGRSMKRCGKSVYSKTGSLIETPSFYNYLTAERNLDILGKLNGKINRDRIYEVLEIVKLRDRAGDKVKSFSHGMKQRLGIAQALLSMPELIILDEPTTGLDPEGMKEIRELILSLSSDFNMTIFLSSHLLHEIEQVCTNMAIIDEGKLKVQGKVHELIKDTEFFVTEIQTNDAQKAEALLKNERWVKDITVTGDTIKVRLLAKDRHLIADKLVGNGLKVSAIIPRASLEDYYLSLVQRNENGK